MVIMMTYITKVDPLQDSSHEPVVVILVAEVVFIVVVTVIYH